MTTKAETESSKIPDWVQADLFEDVLKESVNGYSKTKSFKATIGLAAGENYATIMLRLNIDVELDDGKEKSVSLMLKLPHQLELFQKLMEHNNIFETERNMYNIYVPELEQMYRDVGIEIKLGAQAYKLKGVKTDYILLEDLACKDFKNMKRQDGLDQLHTEAALQRLAQWHAASAVRVATKGPYPDRLKNSFYVEANRKTMVDLHMPMCDVFIKSCSTYKGHEAFIEQVKAIKPKAVDGMYNVAKVDPSEFNVLNHGDLWSNNIMFSHDAAGNLKEACLVDFQLCKYGTVAQDLYYFLLSSTKYEDKLSKFDYYIKFYHEHLVNNLRLLNYTKTMPTLREIHQSLIKYGYFGYMTATGIMTAVLLDPVENANIEMFLTESEESDDFKSLLNTNPRYRKHVEAVMPWLLNRGALELN